MRNVIYLAMLLPSLLSAQRRDVNKDSLKWESQNPDWESRTSHSQSGLNLLEIAKDGTVSFFADIKKDHRIFGYEAPDTNSRKMLLLSVWTFDVDGNPCRCLYGSHYDLSTFELRFVKMVSGFGEFELLKYSVPIGRVFVEKKWVRFYD